MKNITIRRALRALAKLARERGESTVTVSIESADCLAERFQKLDRVFIAAESFVACVGGAVAIHEPWTVDEAEGLTYLSQAVKEAQS